MRLVGGAVLVRVIRKRFEPGQATAREVGGFGFAEADELRIARRRPRERVEPEESEHVINAVKVEDLLNGPYARAPPFEIVTAQFVPAVSGNAPVLAPFLDKRIAAERPFRRRAAAPIQIKDRTVRPSVRTRPSDAKWNIAHQEHAVAFAVGFHGLPLAEGEPLDVHEEKLLSHQRIAGFLRQRDEPGAGATRAAMLFQPALPFGCETVFLHQNAKERVVGKPVGIFHEEGAESLCARGLAIEMALEKISKRRFQQRALERLDLRIIHRPNTEFRQEFGLGDLLELRRRQVRDQFRRNGNGRRFDGQ